MKNFLRLKRSIAQVGFEPATCQLVVWCPTCNPTVSRTLMNEFRKKVVICCIRMCGNIYSGGPKLLRVGCVTWLDRKHVKVMWHGSAVVGWWCNIKKPQISSFQDVRWANVWLSDWHYVVPRPSLCLHSASRSQRLQVNSVFALNLYRVRHKNTEAMFYSQRVVLLNLWTIWQIVCIMNCENWTKML